MFFGNNTDFLAGVCRLLDERLHAKVGSKVGIVMKLAEDFESDRSMLPLLHDLNVDCTVCHGLCATTNCCLNALSISSRRRRAGQFDVIVRIC